MNRSLIVLSVAFAASLAACTPVEPPPEPVAAARPPAVGAPPPPPIPAPVVTPAPEAAAEVPLASEVEVVAEPDCGAERVEWALGQRLDEVLTSRINIESQARVLRVREPGQVYTMEFLPDRLNVDIDESGRVTQLMCG